MGWPSWPFSSSSSKSEKATTPTSQAKDECILAPVLDSRTRKDIKSAWSSARPANDLAFYLSPQFLAPASLLLSAIFAGKKLYNVYLRRMPGANSVPVTYFAKQKTLFGTVTSVGDGDGLRLFHTPGGRLAGWGWLSWRKIPSGKALKDQTISIRIAGVDAPETAHFGKPSQPGGAEALAWLRSLLLGKRVRCHVYKKDQYDRLVAAVKIRRFGGIWRQDVGLLMLRQGIATVYEAKTGGVFGGAKMEEKYRCTEWWARALKRGIWKKLGDDWESPRQFKTRTGTATDTDLTGHGKAI